MNEFCTCGAQLPSDARFCHKCGKPQGDFPVVEASTSEAQPILKPAASDGLSEVSFHNRIAVRTGLLAAIVASLLISIPIPLYLNIVWVLVCQIGAGFLAVFLYRRRTGQELSVKRGARMGWITGVFNFVIFTVFFTITLFTLSSRGDLSRYYREQLRAQGAMAEVDLEKVLSILESPAGLGAIIFLTLAAMFVFFTLLPIVGGAMGAKVLEKER